ncbi:hypothetical protein BVG19_g3564 [[Candida] boidinii]|nr:hypothetical protein BVG19_g3564 [[Candida] boidinii]OWB49583.1 hypothetical protein B5S27_g1124 [[Candida] boidinii]
MDGSGTGQGKNKKAKNKNKNKKNKNKNKLNPTTSDSVDATVSKDNSDEIDSSEISSREQTPVENEESIAAQEIAADTTDKNNDIDNKSDIDTNSQENTVLDNSNTIISTSTDIAKTEIDESPEVDTNDKEGSESGNVEDDSNKEESKNSNEAIHAKPVDETQTDEPNKEPQNINTAVEQNIDVAEDKDTRIDKLDNKKEQKQEQEEEEEQQQQQQQQEQEHLEKSESVEKAFNEKSGVIKIEETEIEEILDKETSELEREKGQPIEVSSGPYSLINIVNKIPLENPEIKSNVTPIITFIESWELNLYIGTSLGEIIHMYKIDDELGYIFVSRQQFNASKVRPVHQIVIFPEIMKALVLCGSTVMAYSLPEFSPANIGKIKDVGGISIDWNQWDLDSNGRNYAVKYSTDVKSNNNCKFVEVAVFTKSNIRIVRVFEDSLILYKDIHYQGPIKGLKRGNLVAVATATNYDLIDCNKVQKIPLLPVSSSSKDGEFIPRLIPVATNECMLVCGGGKKSEPSMGMVVNFNGDVTRGTIPWNSYPTSITIDYPYSLAVVGDNELEVHSLHDQSVIQIFRFNQNDIIKVCTVSHIFKSSAGNLVATFTKTPLISEGTMEESELLAMESDSSNNIITDPGSNTLLYTVDGCIKILHSLPTPLRLMKMYEESDIHNCRSLVDLFSDELKESKSKESTEFGKKQSEFVEILLGLLAIRYFMFDHAFDIWINPKTSIDPRILIYIISGSEHIFGSLWFFERLIESINSIKDTYKLILEDKLDENKRKNDIIEFYKLFLHSWLKNDEILKFGNQSILRTIEIELLQLYINDPNEVLELLFSFKHSKDDSIEILMKNHKYFYLAKYYDHLNDKNQFLYYWKGLIEGTFIDDEFTKNLDKRKSLRYLTNYISKHCSKEPDIIKRYGEWLLLNHVSYGLILYTSPELMNSDINQVSILRLLDETEEGRSQKLIYLNYILNVKNEKQFIGDCILEILNQLLRVKQIEIDKFNEINNNYKSLKISNPSISYMNFLKLNFKNLDYSIINYHNQLYDLIATFNKDVVSISTRKLVIDECLNKLKDYKDTFPMLIIVIEYRLLKFESVVKGLCDLRDFETAEFFANKLQLPNAIKVESMNTGTETEIIKSNNEHNENELSEHLLLMIFDVYLALNDSKLIEKFLNNYSLFSTTTFSENNNLQILEKFEKLMNKIPNNFPISQLENFLIKNIVIIEDNITDSNLLKNLSKADNTFKKNCLKDLQG